MTIDPASTPILRPDLLRRDLDHEAVIWSPIRPDPAALDPIASVMLAVIDGVATVDDLVRDVREVVGVEKALAEAQVNRVIAQLDEAGALVTSRPAAHAERQRELFINPPST